MGRTRLLRPAGLTGLAALASALTAIDVYLATLLVASARSRAQRTRERRAESQPFAVTVLVPAHDEERMIGSTVAALRRVAPPTGGSGVVVIADNCTDATAEIAARGGAIVLERNDPNRRGKGHALNWALDRLDELDGQADAIAIVDADCEPSANLLTSFEARLRDGASAVQAAYAVANPGASVQSSLRFAAFSLMNTVRPLGMERLGLSCGLRGTGMAFRRELLERFRFASGSLVEDTDLHLRLVDAGERVAFAPEASVRSPMPTSARASRAQQSRWEGGRVALLRTWTRPLLTAGVRRRDPVRLHAWMELLVPPQSVLALAHVLLGGGAIALRSRSLRRIAVLDTGLQTIFVIGGLRVVRAPVAVYRALAAAPVLVVQKLGILYRLAVKGAPQTWDRTEREAAS
jgi:cellulose synthase/poly-beta-1,6-N-acetylglucosamine synthase-like glycosyltransferase